MSNFMLINLITQNCMMNYLLILNFLNLYLQHLNVLSDNYHQHLYNFLERFYMLIFYLDLIYL